MTVEDKSKPDPKAIARAKLAARRSRITAVRKKVGILSATLAIAFTGAVGAVGASGFSSPQGGAPTVVATTNGTPIQGSSGQQVPYQPSSTAPVQTAQS